MSKSSLFIKTFLVAITALSLYLLLDHSPLFYCVNIALIILVSIPFIASGVSKLKLQHFKWTLLGKGLFIITFFGILYLPLVDHLTHFSKNSAFDFKLNEKRKMAVYKPFDTANLDSFPDSYTNYFNDNFGFRSLFISNNNYVKTLKFGVSSNKNVIVGKNDWLFYNSANSLKDHLGEITLSEQQLNKITDNLLKRKAYLNKLGIAYYVAVLPNKMGIYSSELPDQYKLVDTTKIDQFIQHISNRGLRLIDFRSKFKEEAKKGKQLYIKNDSHWNENGGFIASQEIITEIRKAFPSIRKPYVLDDYNIEESERPGGDLSDMLGVKDYLSARNIRYHLKDKSNPTRRIKDPKYNFYKIPYKTTFIHERAINAPKLLVFNDSFISYIHNFLGDYFSRSVYVWSHDFRKDFIQMEKPNIVLHMFVERSLLKLGETNSYTPIQ